MLIGDEPSNGNYARYVELLTTGNGGEPGRVYTWRQRAARPIRMSPPTGMPPVPPEFIVAAPAGIAGPTPGSIIIPLPDGFALPTPEQARQHALRNTSTAPARPQDGKKATAKANPSPSAQSGQANSQTNGQTNGQTNRQTLASQANARVTALIFTVLGLGTLCAAFIVALQAVTTQDFEIGHLRPAIFLLAFAFLFFRGAKNARKNTLKPLQPLPSLTTVKTRPPGDSR
jgi:hypothetical protein